MLVHSYLTNGFVKMGEVFLKSLRMVSAPYYLPVWLEGRSLSFEDMELLYSSYPRELLHINNQPLNMKRLALKAGVTLKQLQTFKKQCEGRYVSNKNKVWKLMIAGDDRVKSLNKLLYSWKIPENESPKWAGFNLEYIAHFDIDTLFRKPLDMVPKMLEDVNIYLKLRPGHNIVKARITIDCILIKPANDVRLFFDRWIHYIDKVPPLERPIGYGQASCWLAFKEVERKLNYGTLPLSFGLPGRNKKGDIIWTGNVHKLAKDDCVEKFKKEAGL